MTPDCDASVPAFKDAETERPVPTAWRPAIHDVVRAFVLHDYQLSTGITSVTKVSAETAEQIRAYIEDYGEALIELSEETWNSSVCIWMGTHWDVLIDLWTATEGRSDLVLSAQVAEAGSGYSLRVGMVYVP